MRRSLEIWSAQWWCERVIHSANRVGPGPGEVLGTWCKELAVQGRRHTFIRQCTTKYEAITVRRATERSRVLREFVRRDLTMGRQHFFREAETIEKTGEGRTEWSEGKGPEGLVRDGTKQERHRDPMQGLEGFESFC